MRRPIARDLVTAGLVSAYIGVWGASTLLLRQTSDLDVFFWRSAQVAVHGHPLLIYSVNTLGEGPNSNGPLGLLPLIPLTAVADRMGWAGNIELRSGVTDAVFAIFALLLAATAVTLIERARGSLEWRLATPCVFLLAPALWISIGDYGHVEQPLELWFVVLAAGYALTHRSVLAGIALAFALLTRTTAVLYLIPFALLFLATHRIKPTATVLSVAAIMAAAGFTPFFIADGASAVHSLITYRSDVPIGGGSIWTAAVGTSWVGVAQYSDVYLILAVAAVLSAAVLRYRPGAATTTAGFFGLLTIVATCFPMLSSTTYPYYLLEPYVFASLWWLLRPGSAWNWRIVCPLLLTADALLSKQAVGLPLTGAGLVEGVISSVVLALVAALVMADLLRRREYVVIARAQ